MSAIDNNTNINKFTTTSLNSTPAPVQQQSNVSASPLQLVDAQKQELLKKLGITIEQYEALKAQVPDFDTLSIDKQNALVASLNTSKVNEFQDSAVQGEPKTEKQLYNEKSPDEKVEACFEAFTKNIYINGIKDKNGNYIKNSKGEIIAQAHSEEEWNNLSDAEKQAEIEKVKAFIDKDERLKNVKDTFLAATEKNGKLKEAAADSVMRGILASEFNGISYIEFLQKDEYERLGIVDEFLTTEEGLNKDNLNASDRAYMKYSDTLKSQISKIVSERTGKDVGDNLDASDVAKYMRYYNLDKTELMLNAILEKPAEERTEADLKFLRNYELLDDVRTKAKAQNYISLKDELSSYEAKLANGEELTSEEQVNYNSIKKYMATDDAKQLEEAANHLPKPETDYEKSVNKDVEDFLSQIKDFVHGSDIETTAVITYIDTKCKGMSDAQKKEYIKTFLKFYNSEASVNAFGIYSSKYKDMWADKDLTDKAVLNIDKADTESSQDVADNIENLRISKDAYDQEQSADLIITANKTLADPKCNGSEHDDKKLIFINQSSKHKNVKVQTSSYDTIGTIANASKQVQAVETLQKSENATDELQVYAADNADKLKGEAQLTSLDIATDRSENALKRAAENGIFSRLEKENQQPAMALEHQRLEERLGKEEAIKYTNMLADQIKDCHKDNQLAMHNDIMTSKYSEVQEHAAGNIKDYDPTIQGKALDSVYASGNEKAINSAVESIANTKSVDVVEQNLSKVVSNAVVTTLDNNPEILNLIDVSSNEGASLQEKLASGAKLTPQEYASLSASQKHEYIENFFKSLSPDEKIKLLKSISNSSQQRSIYKMIARTNSDLLNRLITDVKIAKMIKDMNIPGVNDKIVSLAKLKQNSEIQWANFLADEIKNDNKNPDYPPKMASTIGFSSLPFDLQNTERSFLRKNEKFEFNI